MPIYIAPPWMVILTVIGCIGLAIYTFRKKS
jgi:hypothetical protein